MQWLKKQQSAWINKMYRSGSLSPGMSVYRRNFLGIHGCALQQTYPRTFELLGPDCFRYFAQMLLSLHPISSGDLNHYGQEFPLLLEQTNTPSVPKQAVDLARYEWAVFQTVNASKPPSNRSLNRSHITELDTHTLTLIPATQWIEFTYPVHNKSIDSTSTAPTTQSPSHYSMLLFRHENDVFCRELDTAATLFIQYLKQGAPLLQLVDIAMNEDADFPLQEWLLWLLDNNVIMTLNEESPTPLNTPIKKGDQHADALNP